MDKPQHTPGPWIITSCLDYCVESKSKYEAGDEPSLVAICGSIDWENHEEMQDEWEANAHLVSASPDLLGALESIVGQPNEDPRGGTVLPSQLQMAWAAIAKARG